MVTWLGIPQIENSRSSGYFFRLEGGGGSSCWGVLPSSWDQEFFQLGVLVRGKARVLLVRTLHVHLNAFGGFGGK